MANNINKEFWTPVSTLPTEVGPYFIITDENMPGYGFLYKDETGSHFELVSALIGHEGTKIAFWAPVPSLPDNTDIYKETSKITQR